MDKEPTKQAKEMQQVSTATAAAAVQEEVAAKVSLEGKVQRLSDKASMTEVLDAMRSRQTEQDNWKLAEALAVMVPSGTAGFEKILDAAVQAQIDGGLSATTLRLYRDTAITWPTDQRIPNVSFSAHREVQTLGIKEGKKMLEQLVNQQGGPGKVTVRSIRQQIATKQGKAPVAATTSTSSAPTVAVADTVADLKTGGKKLIAAIVAGDDLEKVHAGLTKVMAHVEALRARAARQQAANKAKASAPSDSAIKARSATVAAAAKRQANGKAAGATKKAGGAGDLRGL